jgi:hypothetical protein
MLENLVVLILVCAAAVTAVIVRRYGRFMETRARLIEHIKAAAPEMVPGGPTDIGFTVSVLGAEVDVDLASLLRQRPPWLAEELWFGRVLDELRATVPVPGAPPYALVRDRILPLLKPTSYAALFERYPAPLRLVWRAFVPGVAITYVIGGAHDRIQVTARTLELWDETPDMLHSVALANLRAQTAHLLAELGGPQSRYEHLDGLDASRILVADLIVPPHMNDPLIAIPEETVLLIAPASGRAALASEAAARYTAASRPLSPGVFRATVAGPAGLDVRPASGG